MKKLLAVTIMTLFISVSVIPSTVSVIGNNNQVLGNHPPSPPSIDGDMFGIPGEDMCFIFVSTDYEGDELYYFIDWDDNETTGWIGPYEAGVEITQCHVYDENGKYNIIAKAKDFFNESRWTDPPFPVIIGDHPPWPPNPPYGPIKGVPGEEYTYCTDLPGNPEEDDPYLVMWSWGDGTFSEWMGPDAAGETTCASHSWDESGIYEVKVKIKNEMGESWWSLPLLVYIGTLSALKIDEITGGFFFVNSVIRNYGSWEATDVRWNFELYGGLIIMGPNTTGIIQSIPMGERRSIRYGPVFGLGSIIIRVTVRASDGAHDEYSRGAFVFLFFIKINPGGET